MFRFRLKELIADKAFRENRRITIEEVSKQTGVHRTTLSKNRQYGWLQHDYRRA